MTQEELNNLIKERYVNLGIPSETADKLLNNTRVPAYISKENSETNSLEKHISNNIKDKFKNLSPNANFSLKDTKKENVSQEKKASIAEATRAKKEDLLNALFDFLEKQTDMIQQETLQQGKAGALMFKNLNGDYFTLKLTLNKNKPADFIE